jgi:hypothetical protein
LPNELTTPPVTKMYFIEDLSVPREQAFAPALLRRPVYLSRRSLGGDEHMNLLHHFPMRAIARATPRVPAEWVSTSRTAGGVPPKTVDALMTKGQGAALLLEWNRRAREIEGVSSKIDNHFDLVRGQRVLWMFKRMRGSDDLDCTVRAEFLYDLVD